MNAHAWTLQVQYLIKHIPLCLQNVAKYRVYKIPQNRGLRSYQRGGNLNNGEVNFERGEGSNLGNYGTCCSLSLPFSNSRQRSVTSVEHSLAIHNLLGSFSLLDCYFFVVVVWLWSIICLFYQFGFYGYSSQIYYPLLVEQCPYFILSCRLFQAYIAFLFVCFFLLFIT